MSGDLISRDAVIYYIKGHIHEIITESGEDKNAHTNSVLRALINGVETMPPVNPQESKTGQYEKHIDHTDCIWYGNDSGCPVTCSQYRDGWNDAMDYIYKGGKGYQPYRRE